MESFGDQDRFQQQCRGLVEFAHEFVHDAQFRLGVFDGEPIRRALFPPGRECLRSGLRPRAATQIDLLYLSRRGIATGQVQVDPGVVSLLKCPRTSSYEDVISTRTV